MSRAGAFVEALRTEFPGFDVRPKRGSRLQRALDVALRVVTLGGQRAYLSQYHTVLFGILWTSDRWDTMTDDERYVLLRHERIHLVQRRRMGDLKMALVYLFGGLPLGLAWGRARIEWEAYEETVRATLEVFGREAAEALRPWLVARYTGPDYGWMWPFPRTVERWFDATLARALAEARDVGPEAR